MYGRKPGVDSAQLMRNNWSQLSMLSGIPISTGPEFQANRCENTAAVVGGGWDKVCVQVTLGEVSG